MMRLEAANDSVELVTADDAPVPSFNPVVPGPALNLEISYGLSRSNFDARAVETRDR